MGESAMTRAYLALAVEWLVFAYVALWLVRL